MEYLHLIRFLQVFKRKAYLGIFVFLSALALVLLLFFLMFTYKQTEETIKSISSNESKILSSQFDAALRRVAANSKLATINIIRDALLLPISPDKVSKINNQLNALSSSFPEIIGINIFDSKGMLVFSGEPNVSNIDISDSDYFKHIKEDPDDDLHFTDALVCKISRKITIVAYRSIIGESGDFLGVISTRINLQFFEQLFSRLNVGDKGMVSIRRSDNSRLVVRWPSVEYGINKEALDIAPYKQIQNKINEGVVRYVGRTDGVERIFAFNKIHDFPFFVLVGYSVDEQFSRWKNVAIISTILTVAVVFIISLFIYFLRKSEINLYNSESKFHAVMESQNYAICRWIPDTTITFINDKYAEMLSFAENKNLVGRQLIEFLPENERNKTLETYRQLAEIPTPFSYERSVVGQDGLLCHFHCVDIPLFDSDGKCIEFQSVARDVTESKQAEASLQRLKVAIEHAREVVVITDQDGNIQYTNPAFERATGYTREETLLQNPRILKSGLQDEAFYQNLWTTISSGQTWTGRMVNKNKSGVLYTEEATISPVFNDDRQITNYVAIKRDITEQLKLEEQFIQAQKMECVGRLTGGVAHDFNNILSIVIGYADLAMDQAIGHDELYATLEKIYDAAQRSADIVRQLLAFSRKQTVAPQVLHLNDKVEGMLKMLTRLIGEDIDLVWNPAQNLSPILMDPSQVDQLLANLCVNAKDAIDGVGKITIETKMVSFDQEYCGHNLGFIPGEYVELSISDNGCGIEKETMDKIFEPFFTTKGSQGTGLGLSTVFGIVKQNSGFIHLYSEVNVGTTFRIYLPAQRDETVWTVSTTPEVLEMGHGKTVLLVEDDDVLLEMSTTMLTRLGYHVLTANSPAVALRLAADYSGTIDLLMTDVIMPKMNGKALAHQLLAGFPNLKVLYISGYTSNIIAPHGILDNGIHFLQKPFSKGDLSIKIREALADTV